MAKERKVIRSKHIYKKRGPSKKLIGRLIFILLIVLVAVAGFLVMREVNKRSKENSSSSENSSSVSQTSSETSSEASEPVESSEPEPAAPTSAVGSSKYLSAEYLLANAQDFSSVIAQLKTEGYSSVTVELKPISGILPFATSNEAALSYGAVAENPIELSELYEAISSNGLTPIAAMSTLRDQTAPHVSRENSYAFGTSLEINWLDNSISLGGKPWLNPYMDNTRKYIVDLASEINAAGFNTIILENVMFPTKYTEQLNTIKTQPSREVILGELVTAVKTSLPDALIYASFDAEQLAQHGLAYINTISTTLAPKLDSEAINANIAQLGVDFSLSGTELTVENIAKRMISESFITDKTDGNLLPIIREADETLFGFAKENTNFVIY